MLRLRLVLLLCVVCFSRSGRAADFPDRFEIDGTVGYRFGGAHRVEQERVIGDARVTTAEGRLTVRGGPAFGMLLAYRPQPNGTVFFSYSRQQSDFVARLRWMDPETGDERNDVLTTPGSVEYFQFGGNLETQMGFLWPYLGASIGVTRIAGYEEAEGAQARFNVTLDGGVRFQIVRFLDVRLLGRVPFTFTKKTAFYCYSNLGCAAASSGAPFVQGEVQLGIGLRF